MLTGALSHSWPGYILAFFAAAFGAANVVGGYVVTDRMLEMFKKRPEPAAKAEKKEA
jgi:NAD(P) transhydrogenase subunit alpha